MAQLWFVGQQIGELNFTACKFVPSGIIYSTYILYVGNVHNHNNFKITIPFRYMCIQKKYDKIGHIFGILLYQRKEKKNYKNSKFGSE